jgi:hypothetical protein
MRAAQRGRRFAYNVNAVCVRAGGRADTLVVDPILIIRT